MATESRSTARWRSILGYGAMIGGTIARYQLVVRPLGRGVHAPAPPSAQTIFGSGPASAHADALLHLLLALIVVIMVARALGSRFRYLHQPPVIGGQDARQHRERLVLYPRLSTSDVPFVCFALLMGASMSVTDRRIHTSRTGVYAVTSSTAAQVSAYGVCSRGRCTGAPVCGLMGL